ncbi:hypothetical protein BH09BAC3_BH09BAC3_07670 [soil metagenome]
MTTDRKKAIFFLSLTLVVGILIGSLVPAFYGKIRHGSMKQWKDNGNRTERGGRENGPHGSRQEWLMHAIVRVVKPDSDQIKSIRPITKASTEQIGALEKRSNESMIMIMDSLKVKLKPILTDDQNKKLEEFSTKARSRWKAINK